MTNRRGRARWASLGVLSMICRVSSALADDPDTHVDVQWEAPAECPDLDGVKRYAERLFGQPLEGRCAASIRAQGKIVRNEAGKWQLDMSIAVGDHLEQETLIANRCRALGDSMALKIALACDPLAVVQAIQPDAPQPTATTPPVSPNSATDSASAATVRNPPREPTEVSLGVRAMGAAGFDQLPGVSPGGALYGALVWGLFRVELGGQYYWGGEARYPGLPDVGAHLRLFSGATRACLTPSVGRVGIPVCAGFELGWMEGEGFGVEEPYTARSAWGAVTLGAALRFPVESRVAFWLEGDAVVPFLRPGFNMRNLDTLYTAPEGGARAAGGLEINFSL